MSTAQTNGENVVITTKAALEQKVLYQPSVSAVVTAALRTQSRGNSTVSNVDVISTVNRQSNSLIAGHIPVVSVSIIKQPTFRYVAEQYLPGETFVNPFFEWVGGKLASISYESGETVIYAWSGDYLLYADVSSGGISKRTTFNWVNGLLRSIS